MMPIVVIPGPDELSSRLATARAARADIGRALDRLHKEIDERREKIALLLEAREGLDRQYAEDRELLGRVAPARADAVPPRYPARPPRCTVALYLKGRDPLKVDLPAERYDEARALLDHIAQSKGGSPTPCRPTPSP